MKKIILSLGTAALVTAPIITIGCSSNKENETPKIEGPIATVFDLKSLSGNASLYNTFFENDLPVSSPEIYQFKIDDVSVTNDWTADDISKVTTITGDDEKFDITGMSVEEAGETLGEAFNNLPRLEDWENFITDEETSIKAQDGVTNKYLYYSEDETTASPENADGSWDKKNIINGVHYNSKGHDIYENSKNLIIDAFGELPTNIDLYHVERGGDTAKNLYFTLIDRDANELSEQIKIDIKWNSTQEEIDAFGNGWLSKIIRIGKKAIGKTKQLLTTIIEKNEYSELRPFASLAAGFILEKALDLAWTGGSKFFAPYSLMPGAKLAYDKLLEKPVEVGAQLILSFLDAKFSEN